MKSTNPTKKLREGDAITISETESIKRLTAKDAMIKPVFVHKDDNAIKILKNKDKSSDLRFIYEKMKSIKFPVGNHKRHYISQYQDLDILLPPLEEQQKIAEILGAVDEDIAKTQEVIEATEKLKRGLMQQLFPRGIGHTKFKKTINS